MSWLDRVLSATLGRLAEFWFLAPLPIAVLLVIISAPTSAYIIVRLIGREIYNIKALKKPWLILTLIIFVIQLTCLFIMRTRITE